MSIAGLAREELRALKPYEAAAQVDGAIRLNANEAHWNATNGFRRPMNRYPEVRPARLREMLASRYGCSEPELLVTRGSSEAIDLLVRAFCRPGRDNLVTTTPTFSMYRHYARVQGAEYREVTTDREQDFAVDADAILSACDDDTRLVFLCTPNNPTGTSIPSEVIKRVLEGRKDKSAVVVDEAYIEFSGRGSVVPLLQQYDNLIVLRTLSKALAFAGARCGSVIGPPDVIAILNAIQAPYALATPVVECVEDALTDERLVEARRQVEETVREREQLMDAVSRFGFVTRVWPSDTNFFLISVSDVGRVLDLAAADNVLLRYFGTDLADCIRITVGSRDENDRLLAALAAAERVANV